MSPQLICDRLHNLDAAAREAGRVAECLKRASQEPERARLREHCASQGHVFERVEGGQRCVVCDFSQEFVDAVRRGQRPVATTA